MKQGVQRIIQEGRKFLIALTQDDCVPKSKKRTESSRLLAKHSQPFTKFTEGNSPPRWIAQWILMWLCLLVTTAAAATVPGTVITNQALVNYVSSSTWGAGAAGGGAGAGRGRAGRAGRAGPGD